jgi:hypothetical protein
VPETRGGRQALERTSRGEPVSAHGLLGGDAVGTVSDLELYVPPEMLADLHEPRLVITPGYIGRDRRRPTPSPWRVCRRPKSRLVLVVMVALITSATVVPLTLALAPRGVSATATSPVRAQATAPGTDIAAAPRTRRERPARPARPVRSHAARSAARSTPSTNCDPSAGSAMSPGCLRRQQASQRQDARAAQRASRSEERSAAQAERTAAQAARAAVRAARVAARQQAAAPAP